MDPLHLAIALGPLAVYLFLMGLVNLARRPLLVTGGRDIAALGVGISGLAAAGPIELFLPEQALSRFGPYAWLLVLLLYILCVILIALMLRPRLVIYNITLEQLSPVLDKTATALDPEARWVGAGLVLPHLGVSLHLDPTPALRNVQLVSSGPLQNFAGWRKLELALADALRTVTTAPNSVGGSLVFCGVAMSCLILYMTVTQPQALVAALHEMLRL